MDKPAGARRRQLLAAVSVLGVSLGMAGSAQADTTQTSHKGQAVGRHTIKYGSQHTVKYGGQSSAKVRSSSEQETMKQEAHDHSGDVE